MLDTIRRLWVTLRFRPIPPAPPTVDIDDHTARCVQAMPRFGGVACVPYVGEALPEYLRRVGVRHFAARELTRAQPERVELARSLGFETFDPGPAWWPRLALQALAADRLREHIGEPITVRNAWRPAPYNDAVGGAPDSAHVRCLALDLQTTTPAGWDDAVKLLLRWYDDRDRCLNLGVGESRDTRFLHVGTHDVRDGALSRRRWRYRNGRPVSWHTARLP